MIVGDGWSELSDGAYVLASRKKKQSGFGRHGSWASHWHTDCADGYRTYCQKAESGEELSVQLWSPLCACGGRCCGSAERPGRVSVDRLVHGRRPRVRTRGIASLTWWQTRLWRAAGLPNSASIESGLSRLSVYTQLQNRISYVSDIFDTSSLLRRVICVSLDRNQASF